MGLSAAKHRAAHWQSPAAPRAAPWALLGGTGNVQWAGLCYAGRTASVLFGGRRRESTSSAVALLLPAGAAPARASLGGQFHSPRPRLPVCSPTWALREHLPPKPPFSGVWALVRGGCPWVWVESSRSIDPVVPHQGKGIF